MLKTLYTAGLFMAATCMFAGKAKAQLKGFSIGPYAEIGTPVGDFKDTHNSGFGGGLNADIKLIAGFGVTGSAGFMYFSGKSYDIFDVEGNRVSVKAESIKALPVRVGLKYKFGFPLLYVKAEGGSATFVGGDADAYKGTAAIFAPGIGIRVLGLDVEGKYEMWFKDGTSGFFGLKASYHF
ncbi:hypothetical protein [Chitinophaga pinensis]|uniref:Outer membrane protein beta-barrel domain-containing protein n=1 Tax=Chitinophaga pinensis TaxID=79329 RepID=A0A5C6LP27_9BACT|nr:hypothetical protein [Chitinophaga pinensis]TWV97352.1 hypothetical protein FEF09_22080 [Chitinophaga pinensis]